MKSSFLFLFIQFITIISALPKPSQTDRSGKIPRSTVVKRGDLSSLQGVSVPLTFQPIAGEYLASVQVGTPPQTLNLFIDTGSGLTIIGTDRRFASTSTTNLTGEVFEAVFGSGVILGVLAEETISLAPGLVVKNQNIGIATAVTLEISESFEGIDGIIALAPFDIATGNGDGETNTVMDSAAEQGVIAQEVIGVQLNFPVSLLEEDLANTGTLTYGGVDTTQFCGDLVFVDRFSVADDALWAVDAPGISLGNNSLQTNVTFVFDTGTTILLLPDEAFNEYVEITGATMHPEGFLHFSPSQAQRLPDLIFDFGNFTLSLPGIAQLVPQQLNAAPTYGGFPPDEIIGLVLQSPPGDNTITLGQPALIQFYSVYDTTNNRIGLAPSVNSVTGCS